MKLLYIAIISIFVLSCNKTETEKEIQEPVSTLTELIYPSGFGQSGDADTSVIGYGYNANGLCDTLSVKAKIFNINSKNDLVLSYPRSFGRGITIGGSDYGILLKNMENITNEPKVAVLSHFNNLLKIALNCDTIEYDCSYAYYSYYEKAKNIKYYADANSLKSELTSGFKKDINSLPPKEIVDKYGTHVIIWLNLGAKFEVLYKFKSHGYGGDPIKKMYNRMLDYFGETPGVIHSKDENAFPLYNEQLIFNTIGYSKKKFGLINASNNNANGVHVDLADILISDREHQFISIVENGLIPIYELVDDEKKQELKNYVELFLNN